MKIGAVDLLRLAETASHAARKAGRYIARSRPSTVEYKASGHSQASRVVTEIDREAEKLLLDALASTVDEFDLGVLSEEQPESGLRLVKEHFWCIDPLDGTLPFVEGQPGYAVSVALVSKSGRPILGAIFDPVQSVSYQAVAEQGLRRNGQPWDPASAARGRSLSVFLDRSFCEQPDYRRVVAELEQIARDLGLDGLQIHAQAGAVMNACQVLERTPACYFKFPKSTEGGGSLWDFAATACLFREAGAVATDIHGAPLDLNRADSTFMNHRGLVFASDADLGKRIRALYRP